MNYNLNYANNPQTYQSFLIWILIEETKIDMGKQHFPGNFSIITCNNSFLLWLKLCLPSYLHYHLVNHHSPLVKNYQMGFNNFIFIQLSYKCEIVSLIYSNQTSANRELHFLDIQCHDCCFVCNLIRKFVNLVTLWWFFNVLIEFLDPKNLYVDTKTIILALILKKISEILCSGGHLVRHFV